MSSALTITMSSAHSPPFPSLHLRHNSFSNPSVASPTSRLILQPFRCFTYVKAHSPTLLSLLLRHRIFSYVTWRAAHGCRMSLLIQKKSLVFLFNFIFIYLECSIRLFSLDLKELFPEAGMGTVAVGEMVH